jgi:hypothetical protein
MNLRLLYKYLDKYHFILNINLFLQKKIFYYLGASVNKSVQKS